MTKNETGRNRLEEALSIDSFEEAVSFLLETPKFTSKHDIKETASFLDTLGNPDRRFKIIHVAGTNGKGSVCMMMSDILRAHGFSVGLFTSPHLVDMRERIRMDDDLITAEDFLASFKNVTKAIKKRGDDYFPTFFEYLFFMAMVYYREKVPDYVILETGLGGRLDATNSVSDKLLSVITRIGLDHTEYLGDTIEKIAYEKAGIIKPGIPVVYDAFVPGAAQVIKDTARESGSECIGVSPDLISEERKLHKNIAFSLKTRYYDDVCLELGQAAHYQIENASVAVFASEYILGEKTFDPAKTKEALKSFFWPGRMQEIAPGVIIDGAHNTDGIRAFLESAGADGHDGKRHLIFSAVSDKDYTGMLDMIADSGLFEKVTVTGIKSSRGMSPEELLGGVKSGKDAHFVISDKDAYDTLSEERAGRAEDGIIYVAGSLYLVGEIMEKLKNDQL